MKNKKATVIAAILCSAGLLMACGDEIPEMSEEQTEMVTEYAAGLLMKYDTTSPSRLLPEGQASLASITPDSSISVEGQAEISTEVPADKTAATPGGTPVEDESSESTEDEALVSSDDVTVNDAGSQTEDAVKTGGFGDYITDPGIEISYSGEYELTDSYSSDDNAYFAMDATAGNELLVIHFTLTNTSDSDIDVDMNKYSLKYKVSINGGPKSYVLTTMMSNDILSFVGTVPAGGSQDLVAIAEISEDEAANLDTIDFTIKGDGGSSVLSIK